MLLSRPQDLSLSSALALTSSCTFLSSRCFSTSCSADSFRALPTRSSLSLLRSLSVSLSHHQHGQYIRSVFHPSLRSSPRPPKLLSLRALSRSTSVEQLSSEVSLSETEGSLDFVDSSENEAAFDFDKNVGFVDVKRREVPALDVKELGDLPEQWRRSRLAWLCKELPAHKGGTLVRILNAQRKWMRQEDATYVAVHCMRIRENECGFKVYKWMMQQRWYKFDFALATKLADYMGKERKFSKCREIYDDILNQGRVPCESTFHILTIAYLSAPIQGCLEEACGIYNRMIQLGGYQPQLSLHNSLFRALVSKPGTSSKPYLKQAEFIFHNLLTSGLEIHKDIYGGLIWLHSYQDTIDRERIASLRKEMEAAGMEEGREVLLSILRVCSKEGDVEEAERTWLKLLQFDGGIPHLAFVYKMEVYARVGEPMKSLEIFREMQEKLSSTSVAAYHEIIRVLCKAKEVELAESLMTEFVRSNLKPLTPSYIDMMNMYFNLGLHDKLELAFYQCLEKCRANCTIYSIYLDSLVTVGNLGKAEEIFNQMRNDVAIGVHSRSCNTILRGYLSSGEYLKAEKIHDLMCQKKYKIDSQLFEKLDYVLSLSRKQVKKPVSMKLSKEQREILVGLLLGGLRIESDEERKNHILRFEFSEGSSSHSFLKRHIHDQYHEWLHPSCQPSEGADDVPYRFCTISHSYFGFFADQFWPKGKPVIPKLIHRWLSPRVLAYWYMYGGYRTSSGDILLRLRGNQEGVEKVAKALKAKSLDCRIKRKGTVFWIGLLGSNSCLFWKLTEPYILYDVKEFLKAGVATSENSSLETQEINYYSGSESEEMASNHCEDDS